MKAHAEMEQKLKECSSVEEGLKLLEQMEQMNLHLMALAFADKPDQDH